MAKNIKELTEDEAKKILDFVYLNDKDNWFKKLSFEPEITEEGREQVTFGMRLITGIEYHNGQDNCILHFDNTKVVLWLYKNGYDITDLLEDNSYMSEMEIDFENFSFGIDSLSKGEEGFRDGFKKNWTLGYVTEKCKELLEKYYYKDYE
jgi:hypothetical protein